MDKNFVIGNYDELKDTLTCMASENRAISVESVGESIFGRDIFRVSIGKGDKSVVLAAGADGCCGFSGMLLNFISEFSEMSNLRRRVFNTSPGYVLSCRRIIVYPLLNPDGAEYRKNGIGEDNPISSRLIAMNDESEDFSEWRANGRGVSLERNVPWKFSARKRFEEKSRIYNGSPTSYSGNTPCSEPELCSFLDSVESEHGVRAVVAFSDLRGYDAIYSTEVREKINGCKRLGRSLARIGRLRYLENTDADFGICDYLGESLSVPSYAIASGNADFEKFRELLYTLPLYV